MSTSLEINAYRITHDEVGFPRIDLACQSQTGTEYAIVAANRVPNRGILVNDLNC